MTLKENKKLTLALIEEYSPNNEALTDDEDIKVRLNYLYSLNYQDLAQKKKIIKVEDIYKQDSDVKHYTSYELPNDLYQIKRIVALDRETNEEVAADFRILGKEIYINDASKCDYKIEYYSYPEVITDKTKDNFELEIDQDAQMILPYAVANDILKVDPSANYTAFKAEYERKIAELDTRVTLTSISVSSSNYNI